MSEIPCKRVAFMQQERSLLCFWWDIFSCALSVHGTRLEGGRPSRVGRTLSGVCFLFPCLRMALSSPARSVFSFDMQRRVCVDWICSPSFLKRKRMIVFLIAYVDFLDEETHGTLWILQLKGESFRTGLAGAYPRSLSPQTPCCAQ